MTLLAGAFCRAPAAVLDSDVCERLERLVSRDPRDVPTVVRDRSCFMVQVDIGVHSRPGSRIEPDGTVTLIAGDPLMRAGDESAGEDRERSVDHVHAAAMRGRWHELTAAQGVFSAVHFRPADGQLTLAADRLGLRPLYYWVGDDLVVFASALRVLEGLPVVPKRMDLRGVIESTTLGVPLGTRTVFAGVSLLRAAEIVQISRSGVTRSHYWRWDDIEESGATEEELRAEAYRRFGAAIDLRLNREPKVAAFLSGGLDSRLIAAELLERARTVHTFNFARAGTQDRLLGRAFASAAGSIHHELPILAQGANAKYAFTLAAALNASAPAHPDFPALPRLVWAGDGGSIGVGHVRVPADVVALLRSGRQKAAVARFVEQQRARIPVRLFRRSIAQQLDSATTDGIHEQLAEIHSADPGRRFHLFLLLNDQRRHLADHFEHIDLHRLEYRLPFFDSRFLELIISVPLDLCLGHGFYSRWLACFPEVVRSVPWQTYPGHVPCPLPLPPNLAYQWDSTGSTLVAAEERRRARLHAVRDALTEDFPDPILRRGSTQLALWAYRLGIRDYGYALDCVETLHEHWRRSSGRYFLSAAPTRHPAEAAFAEAIHE